MACLTYIRQDLCGPDADGDRTIPVVVLVEHDDSGPGGALAPTGNVITTTPTGPYAGSVADLGQCCDDCDGRLHEFTTIDGPNAAGEVTLTTTVVDDDGNVVSTDTVTFNVGGPDGYTTLGVNPDGSIQVTTFDGEGTQTGTQTLCGCPIDQSGSPYPIVGGNPQIPSYTFEQPDGTAALQGSTGPGSICVGSKLFPPVPAGVSLPGLPAGWTGAYVGPDNDGNYAPISMGGADDNIVAQFVGGQWVDEDGDTLTPPAQDVNGDPIDSNTVYIIQPDGAWAPTGGNDSVIVQNDGTDWVDEDGDTLTPPALDVNGDPIDPTWIYFIEPATGAWCPKVQHYTLTANRLSFGGNPITINSAGPAAGTEISLGVMSVCVDCPAKDGFDNLVVQTEVEWFKITASDGVGNPVTTTRFRYSIDGAPSVGSAQNHWKPGATVTGQELTQATSRSFTVAPGVHTVEVFVHVNVNTMTPPAGDWVLTQGSSTAWGVAQS